MSEATLFQDRMLRHDLRMAWWALSTLDMKCFYLESRLSQLERKWPGSTPDEQRQLRRERMEVRHEFEMLKIDLTSLERRVESLSKELGQG